MSGSGRNGWVESQHTIKFLEHALNGARTAATGHGHIEFVVMVRHVCWCVDENWREVSLGYLERYKSVVCVVESEVVGTTEY